jgi:hypothetical protein
MRSDKGTYIARPAIKKVRLAIWELNQNMPYTLGDMFVPLDRIDSLVEGIPADNQKMRKLAQSGTNVSMDLESGVHEMTMLF